jgi:DNA-binding winged helix-turn-helix (wHTH) protein
VRNGIIEADYPVTFRQDDAKQLGEYLKNRQSVVLIGAKRVGISNFLRFFLYHKDISSTYIKDNKNHLLIPVDLNDLVEREIYSFWTLTLKRIVDFVGESSLSDSVKKQIESLFLNTIQSQDLFLITDGVRKAINILVDNDILPTLFFIRFDRIKDAINPSFFGNLQSLKDSSGHKIVYVFTGFRSLDYLSKEIFTKASLSLFSKNMYIKPAKYQDTRIILDTFEQKYKLKLNENQEKILLDLVDGFVQYLQLAVINLDESKKDFKERSEFFEDLVKDERIALQSDELWDSLDSSEKEVLVKIINDEKITDEDREKGKYLWDTGLVFEKDQKTNIFSPLFKFYLEQRQAKPQVQVSDFTKKENKLFNLLKENVNNLCERETIVEKVWPEVESFGVSDWAIDRLVARVRNKLELQKSPYEIQTVKTRGYKLIEK